MPPPDPIVPEPGAVRARFPALAEADAVVLDNAGGSQVPAALLDRLTRYLRTSFAQLGGSYPASRRATATIAEARAFARTFVGGDGVGEVVLGASTSALCATLAGAHATSGAPRHRTRRRVVVCTAGHEANVGPWMRMAAAGFEVVEVGLAPADPSRPADDPAIDLAALERVLDDDVRLVAVHHVSNLLGRIEDLAAVVERAHAVGAEVVADGVAYAPHRAPDVTALGVDWYVYSTYKVYGPHMAALFGRYEAFEGLRGPNHFFVPDDAGAATFELGGVNHEACAALLGSRDHLLWLAGLPEEGPFDRDAALAADAVLRALEQPLMDRMAAWLEARRDRIRTIGPSGSDPDVRVPTFSFVFRDAPERSDLCSAAVATDANAAGLGIRFGHFYSHRLTRSLGLEPDDGVVRASLVHYNDTSEVDRLTAWLDERMSGNR